MNVEPNLGTPPATEPPAEGEPPKQDDAPPPAPEPLTLEAIKFPEGFEVSSELSSEFVDLMNKDLSPQERAQALVDLQAKAVTAMAEANVAAWEKTQNEWVDAVKADPEIGGDKLQPTLTRISKMLDEFGTPELRQAFDLTGAGNNPAVIKFLAKLSEQVTEGQFVQGQTPATGGETAAQKLFPSMKG